MDFNHVQVNQIKHHSMNKSELQQSDNLWKLETDRSYQILIPHMWNN